MRFILLAAALLAAVPALGQELSLDEARRRALESQPSVNALRLGARAADEVSRSGYVNARSGPLAPCPTLLASPSLVCCTVFRCRRAWLRLSDS